MRISRRWDSGNVLRPVVAKRKLPQTLAQYYTGGGEVLFNPAHLSGSILSILNCVWQNEV
jgi:hypothetical protein